MNTSIFPCLIVHREQAPQTAGNLLPMAANLPQSAGSLRPMTANPPQTAGSLRPMAANPPQTAGSLLPWKQAYGSSVLIIHF